MYVIILYFVNYYDPKIFIKLYTL